MNVTEVFSGKINVQYLLLQVVKLLHCFQHVTVGVETGSKMINRYQSPSTRFVEFVINNVSNTATIVVPLNCLIGLIDHGHCQFQRYQYKNVK